MLHGKNDYVYDVSEAKKMFIAMRRLDKTAQLAIYEGEAHSMQAWSFGNAVDAVNRALNFLNKCLNDN